MSRSHDARRDERSIVGRIMQRLGGKPVSQAEEDIAVIDASGLFDRQGYLEHYPDVALSGMDPVRHYVQHGAAEGRNPNRQFDTVAYLKQHPGLVESGMNAFRHFCEFGQAGKASSPARGRMPKPPQDIAAKNEARSLRRKRHEDGPAGVKAPDQPPMIREDHFAISESRLFDVEFYLDAYPEVASSGMDPVLHYIEAGAKEGKNPSPYFDTGFYLANNKDVAGSGINPLRHYHLHGGRELRNPSAEFDSGWYWLVQMECSDEMTPLKHFICIGRAQGLETAPKVPLSLGEKAVLSATARRVVQQNSLDRRNGNALARYLERNSIWDGAEAAYRVAHESGDAGPAGLLDITRMLEKQGKHWQVVELLSTAVQQHGEDAELHRRLGMAYEQMGRHMDAATAFARVAALKPHDAEASYCAGLSLERAGELDAALKAYATACRLDRKLNASRLGEGAFHEKHSRWPEACEAYRRHLRARPLDPLLHFKHGLALDRCYEWELACASYRNAISAAQDMGAPYWHYRLGHVLERLGKFDEAASAYQWAASHSERHNPYWHYRQGYALASSGRHHDACVAYLRMRQGPGVGAAAMSGTAADTGPVPEDAYALGFTGMSAEFFRNQVENDYQQAATHFRLGEALEALGDSEGAIKSYQRAIDRSDSHCQDWHEALGRALHRLGRDEEASAAFAWSQSLRRPFGVQAPDQAKQPALRATTEYCECLETMPIRENVILYESHNGASVGGNPYAIFLKLLEDPAYGNWLHVWALKDRQSIPQRYRKKKNVIFTLRDSYSYRRHLATASHLVSDTTFPPWFMRRPGQRYLNTWHGTPLKTLGRDMRGRFLEHRTFVRNLLHATHVISPNPHTTDVLIKKHEIDGIFPGRLAQTGYPRIDLTIRPSGHRQGEIRRQLGIAPGKKVVLYAPTWRGAHGSVHFDVAQLKDDLKRLGETGAHILFRGHSLVEGLLKDMPENLIVPGDVDTNELLSIADVLITDYSSIFFDYIPTRRPIIFYAYDLERYQAERGLYFDIREMPGKICDDIDAVVKHARSALEEPESFLGAHDAAMEKFCAMEDGGAAERTIAFFMADDDANAVRLPSRKDPSILMYAGDFPNNGITSSFLNLLERLDKTGAQVTLALDPANVDAQSIRMERFSQVPESVQVIGRVGGMVLDPEEKWVIDMFNRTNSLPSHRTWAIYRRAFAREFRRVFGYVHFDAHVQFEGFIRYWASLFSAEDAQARKAIFLHSDIVAEYLVRFPHLRAIFGLYRDYDSLVSVSDPMRRVNAEKLQKLFRLPPGKSVSCPNAIDAPGITGKSLEVVDPDLAEWFQGSYVFLTIGRLSPEKDHAKLIEAFHGVHKAYANARLMIVGDGPLSYDLKRQVEAMGLQGAVCMAGQRSNPFPLMRAADCFVLSSNHEGQPMVLLEAMVMGMPIVATDIEGNRGVLEGGAAALVPNRVDGLRDGMLAAIQGELVGCTFDNVAYQEHVLHEFSQIVGARL